MHQQQTAFKNIVEKEEIARNEQFLLFPQCFLLNQIIASLLFHIFDINFYAPVSKDWGHIVLLLSACPSVCKNLT